MRHARSPERLTLQHRPQTFIPPQMRGKSRAAGTEWSEEIADGGIHGGEPLQPSRRATSLHQQTLQQAFGRFGIAPHLDDFAATREQIEQLPELAESLGGR